jgi:SAM-dependent methyltransferase
MMKKDTTVYSIHDLKKNNSLYKTFLELSIDDGWSYDDKIENFELMTKITDYANTPLAHHSILDVGCGTGDLYEYLLQFEDIDYTGIDIFSEGIKKAQSKFPKGRFIQQDFLALEEDNFDFVFSSGALTTKLHTDNYEILYTWVKKMWEIARIGVVFNVLLERYSGDYSYNLFVYNRQRVLELTAKAASKARMKIITTDAGSGDGTEELHVYLY